MKSNNNDNNIDGDSTKDSLALRESFDLGSLQENFETTKAYSKAHSSLYGVFDGHGGYRAAQYCKEKLLRTIANDEEFERNPASAIFRSFFK
jgi:serine/threonine protein phosphatase PrpC